jgi:hypothetical protein
MPVDPIVILSIVLGTGRAITNWLKDQDRKQAIITDLTRVTQILCDILQPLQDPGNAHKLGTSVLSVILDIAETLTSTKEHLALWQAKSTTVMKLVGFLTPGKVVDFLRDDQDKLKDKISLLTLALQVAAMHVVSGISKDPGEGAHVFATHQDHLKGVENVDVREFWQKTFGQVCTHQSHSLAYLKIWSRISSCLTRPFPLRLANGYMKSLMSSSAMLLS